MHYNGVGWVDKPNVSDGLWACWVFNPTYPLCHFFMHSTIVVLSQASALLYQFKKITLQNKSSSIAPTAQVGFLNPTFGHRPKRCACLVLRTSVGFKNPTYGLLKTRTCLWHTSSRRAAVCGFLKKAETFAKRPSRRSCAGRSPA